MESPSIDLVNCFPSLQCLGGNVPDECKGGNVVCPVLPRTPSDSHMRFSKSSGVASTAVSSDSESSSEHCGHHKRSSSMISSSNNNNNNTSSNTTTSTTTTLPLTPQRPMRPHRRIPHTIIERRYRDNLNTQIETLRLTLPSLKNAYLCSSSSSSSGGGGATIDVEDAALPPRLPSKAMIIATAATYIKELESERDVAEENVRNLQQQVVDLQKLIQCNDCSILQYLQAVGGSGGSGNQGGNLGENGNGNGVCGGAGQGGELQQQQMITA
ncbi:uncharacterized protein SEPMUDRAFT_126594 [Sphaerulina musiva SO2202]|uniref:BHLH domain-containing protein n=1 Tax=Sphaerulina musiva (strain SO2202) TaxID=692275 RepID=N1QIU8_SPHMS|nr:uncharacterized protein SEPMUDRAFT_126594 [Sphaerulina musiva SO2202]EMF12339.1 hypothetical protein SEPMUDRAFT_126594 [Sphaerulina musiva SO2202]